MGGSIMVKQDLMLAILFVKLIFNAVMSPDLNTALDRIDRYVHNCDMGPVVRCVVRLLVRGLPRAEPCSAERLACKRS